MEAISNESNGPLLWLASLEKPCDSCDGLLSGTDPRGLCAHCQGTNKVAALDLREPCPCLRTEGVDGINHAFDLGQCKPCYLKAGRTPSFHDICYSCRGQGWIPKQGRDALCEAMRKAGWNYEISESWHQSSRWVRFELYPHTNLAPEREVLLAYGEDADDWLAAAKAMRAVGYA